MTNTEQHSSSGSSKRFARGRRPGVKIKDYEHKVNPNARPNLARFSVSLPVELARVIRALRTQLDMEYSKIFRAGLDEIVRMNKGRISDDTYARYWAARKGIKDSEWHG